MVHQPRVACGRHTCSPFSLLWLVLLFTIFYIGGCRIGRSPFFMPFAALAPLLKVCLAGDGGQLWPTVAEALAGALLGFCIPLAAAMATGGTGLGGGDIKFCGILGLIYGPSGMALVSLWPQSLPCRWSFCSEGFPGSASPSPSRSYLFLPAAALLQRWLNYFYDRRMCL